MVRWLARQEEPARVWRLWFAWYPVKIDGAWVWLEVVERWHEPRGYYTVIDYRHIPAGEEAP